MTEERQGQATLHPESLVAQADHFVDPASGAVVPAIQPSTTFARRPDDYQLAGGFSYARDGTPNTAQVEALLARLESGASAALFASGLGAASAVVQALRPGDRIMIQPVVYWGFRKWLRSFAATWGLELEEIDPGDGPALEAALAHAPGGGRTLIWIETPANPTWQVIDIAAVARLARAAGARLVVDSTAATPVLTRPLELGADLVMHSATKYLNGHSDVLAGALVTAREDDFWQRVLDNRTGLGATLGAFEAWLLLRGLRTLYLRVERASASALAIARHFDGHPALRAVLYPGLPAHPQHDVTRRQMKGGFGGMLSLRVAGGREAALAAIGRCRVFVRATSLGGVESLIEHRATIEGPESPVPDDLLRLSIGIEHCGDLIVDLERALTR